MKKLLKILFVIAFNIALVTLVIFSVGKMMNEKEEEKIVEDLTSGDANFLYDEIEYHEDYEGSLFNESFNLATIFYEGYAPIARDYKWGFIDKNGNMITDFEYTEALYFTAGLAPVRIEDKWGYINTKGEVVIDFIYDSASTFEPESKLACVKQGNLCGAIDTEGNIVIPIKYNYINMFYEGLAQAGIAGKYGFVDTKGNVVIDYKYDDVGRFKNGLAQVRIGKKYGFVDKEGNEVIPIEYDAVRDFEDDYTVARKKSDDNKYYIISKNNEIISCITCDNMGSVENGLVPIRYDEQYVFADIYGNPITDFKYDGFQTFSEGLAAILIDGKWGFINESGDVVIKCIYDEVGDFSEGKPASEQAFRGCKRRLWFGKRTHPYCV